MLTDKLLSGQIIWETPMNLKVASLAAVVVAAFTASALAHHSFAMFDAEKTTTIAGTVKEFQWTNPHAWIMLNVGEQAQPATWAIEMNGPGGLARQGWRPKTLTPGMPVTLTIHPLRDGTNGGQFMSITLPDGTKMGQGALQGPGGAAPARGTP
jgi:Family of unknown function (DUF6152)